MGGPDLLTAHILAARENTEQSCVLVLIEITPGSGVLNIARQTKDTV